jgi:inosine-uridine nucleoside N-ribohydrolase
MGAARLALAAGALSAAILWLGWATVPGAAAASPVPVIIDTDIFTNVDDVGALASALALQRGGEANLIGVTVNVPTGGAVAPDQPRCVAAIDSFYGYPSVPIGVQTGLTGTDSGSPYVGACAGTQSAPATDTAVDVDRKALAAQPDGSVVMVSIGFLGNLAALLQSAADSNSTLTGSALVAQKVKMLVVMGGGYPSFSAETNFAGDPSSAEYVSANWPTKIVWDGYEIGQNTLLGQTIPASQPATSPVRVAYKAYDPSGKAIASWDPTAVYDAIRPTTSLYSQVGPGTNSIGPSSNTFTTGTGTQYYLKLNSQTDLDCSVEALLDSQATASGTGQISGTVTDASTGGQGMAGMTVEAYDPTGNPVESTTTASTGTYMLSGLPAGCYAIDFLATNYAPKYYDGPTSLSNAKLVSVPVGATESGINATFGVAPPTNTRLPTITGTAQQGQTLTMSPGSWTIATSVSDQWEDCDAFGGSCAAVATGTTYLLTASDVGHTIRVVESVSGASGPVMSAPTSVVTALPSSPGSPPPLGGKPPVVPPPGTQSGRPHQAPGPGLTRAAIRALLVKLLARQGRAARIGRLLRGNGVSFSFAAPASGQLVVAWYRARPHGRSVLMASVAVTFRRARTATVRLTLTRAGRRLLRGTARLRITASASFRPPGHSATRADEALILRR